MSTVSLTILPFPILCSIWKFLDDREDAYQLSVSCKYFLDVSKSRQVRLKWLLNNHSQINSSFNFDDDVAEYFSKNTVPFDTSLGKLLEVSDVSNFNYVIISFEQNRSQSDEEYVSSVLYHCLYYAILQNWTSISLPHFRPLSYKNHLPEDFDLLCLMTYDGLMKNSVETLNEIIPQLLELILCPRWKDRFITAAAGLWAAIHLPEVVVRHRALLCSICDITQDDPMKYDATLLALLYKHDLLNTSGNESTFFVNRFLLFGVDDHVIYNDSQNRTFMHLMYAKEYDLCRYIYRIQQPMLLHTGMEMRYLFQNLMKHHYDEAVLDFLFELSPSEIFGRFVDGYTVYHLLNNSDDLRYFDYVLKKAQIYPEVNVDIDTFSDLGVNAFHVACLNNKLTDYARAMLKHKPSIINVRMRDESERLTPILIACYQKKVQLVELLLSHGCSISETNSQSQTPMHIATAGKLFQITKLLLDYDPSYRYEFDNNGMLPVHYAVCMNSLDILQLLIANDESLINARSRNGYSPLLISRILKFDEVAEFLKQVGAEETERDKSYFEVIDSYDDGEQATTML
ncbi:hypothetical protein HK098_002589 [Nowakowskiella sp. JEL0407]|nr:hypothetical protein HK098_002589 [Nowakowskiella sp. JEL0407]